MSLLVVDSSVAVTALLGEAGFDPLQEHQLIGPDLLWSEARSVLHEQHWRGELSQEDVDQARRRLDDMPVERRRPAHLGRRTWEIADQLGVAKTYDAEYLALASLLRGRLITLDARLRRGADRTGLVVSPAEL